MSLSQAQLFLLKIVTGLAGREENEAVFPSVNCSFKELIRIWRQSRAHRI